MRSTPSSPSRASVTSKPRSWRYSASTLRNSSSSSTTSTRARTGRRTCSASPLTTAERADAAQAGHEQIKDDRLRLPSLHLQERLDAVGGGEHHESLLGEVFLE